MSAVSGWRIGSDEPRAFVRLSCPGCAGCPSLHHCAKIRVTHSVCQILNAGFAILLNHGGDPGGSGAEKQRMCPKVRRIPIQFRGPCMTWQPLRSWLRALRWRCAVYRMRENESAAFWGGERGQLTQASRQVQSRLQGWDSEPLRQMRVFWTTYIRSSTCGNISQFGRQFRS